MTDVFTPDERSRVMAAVRSRGNRSTETALAVALRAAGITGWRRHYPILGKPDFAFPRHRLAIFLDGCFWHGCPKCGEIPASNRSYWERKIGRNVERDRRHTKELRRRGWAVLRIWEHRLRGAGIASVIARLERLLETRKKAPDIGRSKAQAVR
jgi:DNA mismatch endonuclease (patch repair protein)